MEWMLLPYRRYADFGGRSRRREFWLWGLFTVLVSVVIGAVFGHPVYQRFGFNVSYSTMTSGPGELLQSLFNLFNLVPGLAVGARRLHDIDRSGWWQLLWFVPFIGWLILLVFFCLDSNSGPNRFGPDPKERGTADVFR